MAKQAKKDLTISLVLNSDGSVNREESMAMASIALDDFISTQSVLTADVAAAVHAVFDKYPGAGLNVPFIVTNALMMLNVTPSNSQALTKAVHDYITSNSQGDKDEAGNVANPNSLFIVGKGRGASTRRRSDVTE